jgi:ribosomal protein S18 acetylase RimI-like enzyme
MSDVEIRMTENPDMPFIKAFSVALYEHVGLKRPSAMTMGPNWTSRLEVNIEQTWTQYIDYVACDEGVPIGMIRGKEFEPAEWTSDRFQVELAMLYVLPAYRKQGVGRKLIAQLLDRAREEGYPEMILYVHPANVGARRLYDAVGFEEIDEVWRLRL